MGKQIRAVIIAAAPTEKFSYILNYITDNDFIMCADGGLKYAQALKIKPDYIVGDFDSFKGTIPENINLCRLDTVKDDTDTMHCIDIAEKLGYKNILLLCATGGRLDHTFANLVTLDYARKKNINLTICSGAEEITLLTPDTYNFNGYKDRLFSLFAFNCTQCVVSYSGVFYPLENYNLQADNPLGISNIFIDDKASITIHSGKALLMINNIGTEE